MKQTSQLGAHAHNFPRGRAAELPTETLLKMYRDMVEQRRFERLDPPLTPRRAVVASVASVLLGSQLGALSLRATSFSSSGGRGEREDEADLWELQRLSPAEELVAAVFRPAAQATL
jgi:hypothetical protein